MKKPTRLLPCALSTCEGICCSDGAYLRPEEERRIHRLVKKHAEHFDHLPPDYIIEPGPDDPPGRKTQVRAHRYRNKPAHFSDTRCVFTEADGRCSLQTLAVAKGKHKWAYKPAGCWLFPLISDDRGKLVPPPRHKRDDPHREGHAYPGFVTYTPCGGHAPEGKLWWHALKEEVAYFKIWQYED
jgi:hypothetical protein